MTLTSRRFSVLQACSLATCLPFISLLHLAIILLLLFQVWDDELAATAQRWADQCTTAHDRAAQRDVGRFPVGQNLAATWTTRPPSEQADSEPDFMKQINAWFDEVHIYGFKPISGGHGTGHYSQVNYLRIYRNCLKFN